MQKLRQLIPKRRLIAFNAQIKFFYLLVYAPLCKNILQSTHPKNIFLISA